MSSTGVQSHKSNLRVESGVRDSEDSVDSESFRQRDFKDLWTSSLWGLQNLRTLRLRVFRTLKLFVLSDFESLGVADYPYFKTPSL